MDRIIKFRAWDAANKCFNDTVAGNLLMQLHEPSEDVDTEYGKRFFLQQFTGLKDIWGVEIYEGDVVKWGHMPSSSETPERIAIVEIKPDIQFKLTNGKHSFKFGNFSYQNTNDALEVIGNIYQNPELLLNNPS